MLGPILTVSLSAIVGLANWKADVQDEIKSNANAAGKIVEVCVNEDCVTVDRSNDPVFTGSIGGSGGPYPKTIDKTMFSTGSATTSEPEATKPTDIDAPLPKVPNTKGKDVGIGDTIRELVSGVIDSSKVKGSVEVQYQHKIKNADGAEESTNITIKVDAKVGK